MESNPPVQVGSPVTEAGNRLRYIGDPYRARTAKAQTCRKKAARADWRSSSMLTTHSHASLPGFLRRWPSLGGRGVRGFLVDAGARALSVWRPCSRHARVR